MVVGVRKLWIPVSHVPVKMELSVASWTMITSAPAWKNLTYVALKTHTKHKNNIIMPLVIYAADSCTQGRNCEIDLNRCRSDPCLNGGTCSNSPNKFECTCAPGFNGSICEHKSIDAKAGQQGLP